VRLAPILAAAATMLAATGTTAQEHSVTLKGIIFDATTGYALPEVAIHVDQNLIPAHTDTIGEFLITGLTTDSHTLTMAKRGYGPRVYSLAVTEHHGDTVEIGPYALAPAEAITATISGTVVDSKTGQPVIVSGVYVNGTLADLTNDGGGFTTERIEVLPGLNTLEYRRLGYQPFETRLWAVQQHTDLDLEVHLDPLPVAVPPVTVEARYLREFEKRTHLGFGHLVTQQEIEEQHPFFISELMRTIPGVIVKSGIIGNRVLPTRAHGCLSMRLFIDGQFIETDSSFMPAEQLDFLVHPDNVAAIEVFPSPAGVPVQYNNRGSACGVILVWTRR